MRSARGADENNGMARDAGPKTHRTSCGAANTPAPSKQDRPTPEAATAGLVALAEELGRLLARRELALRRNRRGYSLPELIYGAFVMAVVWILIARTLGGFVH